MPRLAVLRAAGARGRGAQAWVRREAVLGRRQGDTEYALTVRTEREEVALEVHDALIGRRHARLYFEGERLFVQDLGSKNGTFLDGQPLPSGGPGHAGAGVLVPQGVAQLRLGPRSLVELTQEEAPLGLAPETWLSTKVPYTVIVRDLEICSWGQDLQRALANPMTPRQVQEWYARRKDLLAAFPDLGQQLEELVRRLELRLLPDDTLEAEERAPLEAFCRDLPTRLSAHYLNR